MTHSLTRRTFIAGLAGLGAACGSNSASVVGNTSAQASHDLTVFFTGLTVFQHDRAAKAMKVGLLGYDHETIIVARKEDVDSAGSDFSTGQTEAWHVTDLDYVDMAELTYWKASNASIDVASTGALSVRSPFQVFPLAKLAKRPPVLTNANCQSLLTFTSGEFSGHKRSHSCGHEEAPWNMVTGPADTAPSMKDVKLLDTVRYNTKFSTCAFTIGRTKVSLKPQAVKIWVMQLDSKGPVGKDPKEILHCQHYYDVVEGYSGERYYPRRNEIPESCKVTIDADPIYCTPGEGE